MKNKEQEPVTVGVCMITYNHEDSIAAAIEGVLMQEAEFRIKLYIGEDCGTDKTRKICQEYVEKYPDQVELLPSTKNLGMQKNFFRTLEACLGADFVANCDGDDKWTDRNKLAHQVEFMRNNPEYSAHTHNVVFRDLMNATERPFGEVADKQLTANELVGGWPYSDASMLIRSSTIRSIPMAKLPHFISYDRFLNYWIAFTGSVFYEGTKTMAVYHRHARGASETISVAEIWGQDLSMFEFLKPYFPDSRMYRKTRATAIARYVYQLAREDKKSDRSRLGMALEYVVCTVLQSRSDIYTFLLILFGRPFFRFHQRTKGSLAESH